MANISGVLYEYHQKVQSYITSSLPQYSCWGYSIKRINALAAFVTVIVGFIAGAFRIVLEPQKGNLDPNSFLFNLEDVNFLTFGA